MIRIVDLSIPLENGASEPFPPVITYKGHKDGAQRLGKLANVNPSDFPDGMALATEQITLTTHSGTHVDAPWHYGPACGGRRSRTIDEIPLEWCYGPGVNLNFLHMEPGGEILVRHLEDAAKAISYRIRPGDITLIQTGADKYWGTDKYMIMQCGLSQEGTQWLLDQGVRCIGIDAWGLDRPVAAMAEAHKRGDAAALWPSHFYGRKREYIHIEKLANLDKLPPYGFTLYAFPVRIAKASAGWCRAVAFVSENP